MLLLVDVELLLVVLLDEEEEEDIKQLLIRTDSASPYLQNRTEQLMLN
jgi:hypothetical protein